jgi:predicted adenylyl cyclase CyaB
MLRNVEIKARVQDLIGLEMTVLGMANGPSEQIKQHDTFFECPSGRLKLRRQGKNKGQLIFYSREDTAGPRESHYIITETDDPDGLTAILKASLGVRGVVKKRRMLYRVGQTRIHLDSVEGLGDFIELEVVLADEQPHEEGEKIANNLMKKLGIKKADLIPVAYVDLLQG